MCSFTQFTKKLWNPLRINPELSDTSFQEEHNTKEIWDKNEDLTNQSNILEKISSLSKDISGKGSKNSAFEIFPEENQNMINSDKNLILSHISNNKTSSMNSNSQDCQSIVNHLENDSRSSKTSELNFNFPKNEKKRFSK